MVNVVIEYLQSLPTEELYNLWIFGIVVTEEEANKNKEYFIDQAKYWYKYKLFSYATEKYNSKHTDAEEDILFKAGEREFKISKYHFLDTTEEENLEQYKKLIIKAITDYPEEATAYCRAFKMIQGNYSERAILSTIDKILSNGTTTD